MAAKVNVCWLRYVLRWTPRRFRLSLKRVRLDVLLDGDMRGRLAPSRKGLRMSGPNGPSVPPPGWYNDGSGNAGLRWWDGHRWTEFRNDASTAQPIMYSANLSRMKVTDLPLFVRFILLLAAIVLVPIALHQVFSTGPTTKPQPCIMYFDSAGRQINADVCGPP